MRISNNDVSRAIAYTCTKAGRPELASKITFEWSNRLRTTMGLAHFKKYPTGHMDLHMRLSAYIYSSTDRNGQLKNVIHETCHLIDSWEQHHGHVTPSSSHGRNWKRLMRLCGLPPERCHSNPVKRNKTYEVKCACSTYQFSGQRMSKIVKKRVGYSCKKCKHAVIPTMRSLSEYLNVN